MSQGRNHDRRNPQWVPPLMDQDQYPRDNKRGAGHGQMPSEYPNNTMEAEEYMYSNEASEVSLGSEGHYQDRDRGQLQRHGTAYRSNNNGPVGEYYNNDHYDDYYDDYYNDEGSVYSSEPYEYDLQMPHENAEPAHRSNHQAPPYGKQQPEDLQPQPREEPRSKDKNGWETLSQCFSETMTSACAPSAQDRGQSKGQVPRRPERPMSKNTQQNGHSLGEPSQKDQWESGRVAASKSKPTVSPLVGEGEVVPEDAMPYRDARRIITKPTPVSKPVVKPDGHLDEGGPAALVESASMMLDQSHPAKAPSSPAKTPGTGRITKFLISNKRNQSLQTDPVVTNSCLCIGPDSIVRTKVYQLMFHPACEKFILVCVMISCLTLAVKDPAKGSNEGPNAIISMIDLIVLVVFTGEMVLKMFAQGIIIDEQSYLRDSWNVVDFVVVLVSLVDLFMASDSSPLKPLRLMRSLKSLRLLKRLEKMRMLVETIIASFSALGSVFVVLMFYLTFLGMLGVQFFKGSFHNQCFKQGEDGEFVPAMEELQSQAWLCTQRNPPLEGAYTCKADEVCMYVRENRNFGVTSFDNIGVATLTVFVATTLEGWSDLMYDLEDTRGSMSIVWVFMVVFMGNFVIMNLALAVIFENYQEAKAVSQERSRRQALEAAILAKQLAEEDVAGIEKKMVDDMVHKKTKAMLGMDNKENPEHDGKKKVLIKFSYFRKVLEKRKRMKQRGAPEGLPDVDAEDEDEVRQKVTGSQGGCCAYPAWWENFRMRYLLPFVNRGEYMAAVMAVVVMNVISLCTETADMTDEERSWIESVNSICTWIFTAECFFHIMAKTLVIYVQDVMNCFDLGITIMTLLEMVWIAVAGAGASGGAFSAFRAVRIMRIFKLAKSWKSLQKFIIASVRAAEGSLCMCVLMMVFMFVFAIMGRDLFSGKLPEGSRPLYENVFWSFVTTFQIISGENWNDVMYNTVGSIGWSAMIYVLAVYCIGNILLMNLFVSILIDTFVESSGELKEDKDEEPTEESGNAELSRLQKLLILPAPLVAVRDKYNSIMSTEQDFSNSLCIFSSHNPVRRCCTFIVNHWAFDNLILVCILVSTYFTIADTYVDESPTYQVVCGNVFAVLFLFEMVVKVISMGFLFGKDAYLHDPWNIIDCITTVISIMSISIPALTWARALRSARPLRIINRIKSFRIITTSIFYAFRESSTIGALALIFWVLLAVFGMQLFLGAYSDCSDPSIMAREDCEGYFTSSEGELVERVWATIPKTNFDTILDAMMTTFEIATLEMWPDIMYDGVDVQGTDLALDEGSNRSSLNALYFVLVVLVFGFFIINLFVGIVMDTFNSFKTENEERDWAPSWVGEEWLDTEKDLDKMKPIVNVPCPKNLFQAKLHAIAISPILDTVVNLLILATFFVSCLEHYQQPQYMNDLNEYFMFGANIFFAVEVIIKLGGFGLWYFVSNWNRFDLVTTCVTLFMNGSAFSAMRVIRFVRIFRVLHQLKGFRTLVAALLGALPGIGQAAGVMVLVLMMYAITGNFLFQDVVYQSFINKHANFENFTTSMITLFRCATGESYNAIMHDLAVKPPNCDPDLGNCGSVLAYPYMLSFVLLVQMILINMFIAVTLSSYTDVSMSESRLINSISLYIFNSAWEKVDPEGTGYFHVSLIPDFFFNLKDPFGLLISNKISGSGKRASTASLMVLLQKLRLNMNHELLDYEQVLFRVMSHAYLKMQENPVSDEERNWLLGRINHRLDIKLQREEARRMSKMSMSAGELNLTSAMLSSSKPSLDPGTDDQPSELVEKLTVLKDYLTVLLFPENNGADKHAVSSKMRHAKLSHKQSEFYLGPVPPGSGKMKTVEFYFALQIVAFHVQTNHPTRKDKDGKDNSFIQSQGAVDPLVETEIHGMERKDAAQEAESKRVFLALQMKHKNDKLTTPGDQISRRLEQMRQQHVNEEQQKKQEEEAYYAEPHLGPPPPMHDSETQF